MGFGSIADNFTRLIFGMIGYLQLAGGTNAHTVTSLKEKGLCGLSLRTGEYSFVICMQSYIFHWLW